MRFSYPFARMKLHALLHLSAIIIKVNQSLQKLILHFPFPLCHATFYLSIYNEILMFSYKLKLS